MRSCFLSSFFEFCSAVSSEKSKISQPIRGQGGHLVFQIGPKNTNLVEDVKSLLPVKFRWIPFSGFREEVENVSANQRLGRPSCFSDRPEKHKLGRWRWDLASCQVSLNSVQRFQRRSWKCESLRTDDGRCAMTIAHLSLWLRWAKNYRPQTLSCQWTSKVCDIIKLLLTENLSNLSYVALEPSQQLNNCVDRQTDRQTAGINEQSDGHRATESAVRAWQHSEECMCRLQKHSYAWLPRKYDYRTDRQTDAGQSDPYVPNYRQYQHHKPVYKILKY